MTEPRTDNMASAYTAGVQDAKSDRFANNGYQEDLRVTDHYFEGCYRQGYQHGWNSRGNDNDLA